MDFRKTAAGILDPLALDIDPNSISRLSAVTSIFFLFAQNTLHQALIIFIVLLLDLYDGLVARKYGKESKNGLIVDLACDRVSELVIFIRTPYLLFFVFANVLLSVLKIKKGCHVAPLRHIYMLYLLWVTFA